MSQIMVKSPTSIIQFLNFCERKYISNIPNQTPYPKTPNYQEKNSSNLQKIVNYPRRGQEKKDLISRPSQYYTIISSIKNSKVPVRNHK